MYPRYCFYCSNLEFSWPSSALLCLTGSFDWPYFATLPRLPQFLKPLKGSFQLFRAWRKKKKNGSSVHTDNFKQLAVKEALIKGLVATDGCSFMSKRSRASTASLAVLFEDQSLICDCMHAQPISHVPHSATPWTAANQTLLCMGFSRQKY